MIPIWDLSIDPPPVSYDHVSTAVVGITKNRLGPPCIPIGTVTVVGAADEANFTILVGPAGAFALSTPMPWIATWSSPIRVTYIATASVALFRGFWRVPFLANLCREILAEIWVMQRHLRTFLAFTRKHGICLFVSVLPSPQSHHFLRIAHTIGYFNLLGRWSAVFVRMATAVVDVALIDRATIFCNLFH